METMSGAIHVVPIVTARTTSEKKRALLAANNFGA
jgi:hypothetical protein